MEEERPRDEVPRWRSKEYHDFLATVFECLTFEANKFSGPATDLHEAKTLKTANSCHGVAVVGSRAKIFP